MSAMFYNNIYLYLRNVMNNNQIEKKFPYENKLKIYEFLI